MAYILLIVGFVLLIKGADWFVDGSSSLAKILKIPTVIIGLTIVAMGTSAPEASVSMNATLVGNNDIALSNVIGSNIFNSLIVVGVCAVMKSFVIDKEIMKRDLPVNVMVSIVLCLLVIDGELGFYDGLILIAGMVIYIVSMIASALKNRTQEDSIEVISVPKSLLSILIGLLAVIYGGQMVVDHATTIALSLGLSQTFIGLTIVAIGTSLPELVTSIVATRKGESGLALGNAVGSNIFNILFILGASSLISPLSVIHETVIDSLILIGVAGILYIFSKTKNMMSKKEGIICVVLYIAYTFYLFIR